MSNSKHGTARSVFGVSDGDAITPLFARQGDSVRTANLTVLSTSPVRASVFTQNRISAEDIAALEHKADKAREQGRSEGDATGYQRGLAEGAVQGQAEGAEAKLAELQAELTSHGELVEALAATRDRITLRARTEAVSLALSIARRLVGGMLDDADVLSRRLNEALQEVADGYGEPIRVRTSPVQLEIFRSMSNISGPDDSTLHFESDADLQRGDLIIECRGRTVRSIVDEQLMRIEEAIA